MSFTAPQFTTEGKELLSRALSGECAVRFTSIALGSGSLTSQAIEAMTGLITEQKRIGLEVYQRMNSDTVNVRGTFNNSELTAGFYWREIGLFAQNPDDPDNRAADILFCYQNAGDLAEYIPSVNNEVMEKTISLTVKISDAAEVNAILLSEVYADKDAFEQFQQDTAAQMQAMAEQTEETYVKKSGDEMSGPLLLNYLLNAAKNGYLFIGAGETVEDLATSSYFQFYGPNTNSPGKVLLVCRDAEGQAGEVIAEWTTEGFKWKGSQVLTAAGGELVGQLKSDANNALEVIRNDFETIAVRAENKGTGKAIRFGIGSTGTRGIYDETTQHWIIALNPDNGPVIDGSFAVVTVEGAGANENGNVTLSNVVHRTENETIDGLKTFSQNLYTKKDAAQLVLQNTAMIKGGKPDNTLATNVIFGTSGGVNTANSMAQIYATQHTNGNTSLNLRVFKNTANVSTSKIFSLIYNLDDTTGIKWGDEQVVCVTSWTSGANWYRKYSDGWIEQGGFISASTEMGAVSQTYHTPFTTARCPILIGYSTDTGEDEVDAQHISAYSKTGFTAIRVNRGSEAVGLQWYACGY